MAVAGRVQRGGAVGVAKAALPRTMETTTQDLAALVAARRLMVTGAAGFIGAHLVAALARLGAERVVALDRAPLATNPLLRGLAPPKVVQELVALGDCTPDAICRAVRGVDAVFHLAAVKYRPQGEPLVHIVRTNALGTAALVEACAEAHVSKIVFASSLYAYGRMCGGPLDEGERPEPRTAYGLSKRFGEELCGIGGGSALRATVLRYMFVYGPGQSPKHGYPSVIVKNFLRMLAGAPPLIYGDGAQVLDYVFVDDVVAATIRALAPVGDGRIYNVGSGEGSAIRDVITLMRDVAGFAGQPVFAPPDLTAGTSRVARIERIRAELGWAPTTDLRSGLASTLASIRQHPDWYSQGETSHVA